MVNFHSFQEEPDVSLKHEWKIVGKAPFLQLVCNRCGSVHNTWARDTWSRDKPDPDCGLVVVQQVVGS